MTAEPPSQDLAPLPSPEIPWQWLIGWNRLSTPFAQMDTVHIGESLFVASCGPYILDFGYYTHHGTWAYVLTVCDGPFCGQTPVVYEKFADRDPALGALSHWMAKLAATCDASGATLEKITQTDAQGALACQFNPPGSPRILNPTSKYIWSLFIWQSAKYWLGDCGDASLRFTDKDGATVSELVFLLREPYGVYVLFLPTAGLCSIASRLDRPLDIDIEVELTHGGAPLTIPRRMLISRNDAAEIAKSYVDTATLHLGNCAGLARLPARLTVGRCLQLAGCSSLATLPPDLMIEGGLVLADMPLLQDLPSTMGLAGGLCLINCDALTHLPDTFTTLTELEIHGCANLMALPRNLRVSGSIKLMECPALDGLPQGLRVNEYVSIRGCPGLAHLDENTIKTWTGARHVVLQDDVPY